MLTFVIETSNPSSARTRRGGIESKMKLTRRQFIVTASATSATAAAGAFILTGDAKPAFVWRGAALGGEARVSLYGADKAAARPAIEAVALEIERLEAIFSLHRPTSQLSRLNAAGTLTAPSSDIVTLLRAAIGWRTKTNGAFDPTVQPLWQAAADGIAVSPELMARAGTAIEINSDAIRLVPGTSLTLNGIALGHIADRVAEILVKHGFSDVVVDTGELRLLGQSRRAIGIPAVKAAVSVAGVAIATSEPKSKIFDTRTFRHHLIDPKTGASPRHWESVSVFAPTAEMADALSTAFAVLPHDAVADIVSSLRTVAIIGADGRGRVRRFGDMSLVGGGAAS